MLPVEIKMEIGRVRRLLQDSDASLIRAFEDLLKVLVAKKIIDHECVNDIVHKNMLLRKEYRSQLKDLHEQLDK